MCLTVPHYASQQLFPLKTINDEFSCIAISIRRILITFQSPTFFMPYPLPHAARECLQLMQTLQTIGEDQNQATYATITILK